MTVAGTEDRARRARAEASAWIARLHGPNRTPELEAGFQRWLGESEHNAREFEALTEVWESMPGISAGSLSHQASDEPVAEPFVPRSRPHVAWGLAASALIAALSFFVYNHWFAGLYDTKVGEQRIVLLGDGTQISLNSGTRLRSQYDGDERGITLDRGEALFEVAHDAQRPFVVRAGAYAVTAIGTKFTVRHEQGRVAVVLVEGKVAVTSTEQAAGAAVDAGVAPGSDGRMLAVGQRLTLNAGAPAVLDTPDISVVTAWRRGEIVLDQTPLGDAIAELNRYTSRQLVLGSPELASLPVSGLYHTGDSERFARALAQLHGLNLEEQQQRIVIKSR
ncbi:FecR family protein [Steroidobacter sp.]|uniref:FecR family protein n=1 Tax=Steroidobacter sp. TaxID=1978227 RepID=UPI001A52EE73|nr:FecR family protein [Steroidobacter sp.]MBL8267540.1 FecR family protein [Steroidobacter sp.]